MMIISSCLENPPANFLKSREGKKFKQRERTKQEVQSNKNVDKFILSSLSLMRLLLQGMAREQKGAGSGKT
jgi:hypothetical protein